MKRKSYESPVAETFDLEQPLSFLSYFSGVGTVDQWEEGDELEYEELE